MLHDQHHPASNRPPVESKAVRNLIVIRPTIIFSLILAATASGQLNGGWQPLFQGRQLIAAAGSNEWVPYGSTKFEPVADAKPSTLRVHASGDGIMMWFGKPVLPRGGMGNRLRARIEYRIVQGGPVEVHSSSGGQLTILQAHEWET